MLDRVCSSHSTRSLGSAAPGEPASRAHQAPNTAAAGGPNRLVPSWPHSRPACPPPHTHLEVVVLGHRSAELVQVLPVQLLRAQHRPLLVLLEPVQGARAAGQGRRLGCRVQPAQSASLLSGRLDSGPGWRAGCRRMRGRHHSRQDSRHFAPLPAPSLDFVGRGHEAVALQHLTQPLRLVLLALLGVAEGQVEVLVRLTARAGRTGREGASSAEQTRFAASCMPTAVRRREVTPCWHSYKEGLQFRTKQHDSIITTALATRQGWLCCGSVGGPQPPGALHATRALTWGWQTVRL